MLIDKIPKLLLNYFIYHGIGVAGIEVTNNCNLRCKHCYHKFEIKNDLKTKEWEKIFIDLQKQGISVMGYIGGEPLLKKDLIMVGKKYFPINFTITNGTLPLPNWKDMVFGVSVDGTQKYHKLVRGDRYEGRQYEIIKNNILEGVKKGLKIYVLMTISKINQENIEDFIGEWHQTGVKGAILDFMTPSKKSDANWISFSERNNILERIKILKKKYKEFLPWNTDRISEKMSYPKCQKHTALCFSKKDKRPNLNFQGKKLFPCIMGNVNEKESQIDCSRCGCMTAYLDSLDMLSSIKMFF